NALTNLEASMVSKAGALSVCGRELPILGTYGDAEPGQCFGLIGSLDVLEIAVRDGHAAQVLGLTRGSPVVLR
ncbi:MAG TPA: SAM hydroxide adenosyltransferase, partial [Polyangiaceae bacterium]